MNFDQFRHELRTMRDRITSPKAPGGLRALEPDEAYESLGVAMEELSVVEEELRTQLDALAGSKNALEREQERYRDLFENAPDGYLVTDLNGVIRQANRAACTLLNLDWRLIVGKPLVTFVPEEGRTAFRAELHRLAHAPTAGSYELRLKPRRGAAFDAAITLAVERDALGRPAALRWALRDVTLQQQAGQQLAAVNEELERRVAERTAQLEAELRRRERMLERTHAAPGGEAHLIDLIDDLDAIIWRGDPATGRPTFVSRGTETILGYPASRWIDEPDFWADRLHPDDRPWAVEHRERALRAGRDYEAEYRLMAADGRGVWFRESVRVVRGDAGRPAELRGLLVNISRRKKVERQLYIERREISARLDELTALHDLSVRLSGTLDLPAILREVLADAMAAQGAPKGLIRLVDRERNVPTVATHAGLSPEAVAFIDGMPGDAGACGRAATTGAPLLVEDILAEDADPLDREAGRLGSFRAICAVPLRGRRGGRLGSIALYFDRPHRPADRALRLVELFAREAAGFIANARLHEEIREGCRRREVFLSVLAHELRNPLSAIVTSLHLLRLPELNQARHANLLEIASRQAGRLGHLVDELMDAARIAQGKVALRMQPIDLCQALGRAVESVRHSVEAKRHELAVTMPDTPLALEADADRLEQVLVNLLSNAVKYTEPGGRVEVSATLDGEQAVVRVRDSGAGIDPRLLPMVFDLYAQSDASSEGGEAGLGIGLWLARRLIEMHGGTIAASSAGIGLGSEFVIRLRASGPWTAPPAALDNHLAHETGLHEGQPSR
jgi:PAS domain S-box-containing protein